MSLGSGSQIFGEGLEISSTVGLKGTPKVMSYPRTVTDLRAHEPSSFFGVVKGKMLTFGESPKVALGAKTPRGQQTTPNKGNFMHSQWASHQELGSFAGRSGAQSTGFGAVVFNQTKNLLTASAMGMKN